MLPGPRRCRYGLRHCSDGQLILQSMRAGAKEFLTLPISLEELVAALSRIAETKYGGSGGSHRSSKIVAVAGDILGRRIPCLYGGSVNPDNCRDLMECPNIDGLFIGRSAWQVEGYLDILSRCSASKGVGP